MSWAFSSDLQRSKPSALASRATSLFFFLNSIYVCSSFTIGFKLRNANLRWRFVSDTNLVCRQTCYAVQTGNAGISESCLLRSQRSNSIDYGGSQKNKSLFSFLEGFDSPNAVAHWMEKLIVGDSTERYNAPWNTSKWTSHDDTAFIRALRDFGAFDAILLFVRNFARRNVFVYTTAMASIAQSETHRSEGLTLFLEMNRHKVKPSTYTMAALFQVCDGPRQVIRVKDMLKSQFPEIQWTSQVWEAAVYACSRGKEKSDSSWITAELLLEEMINIGLTPSVRLFQGIFQAYTKYKKVENAMSLLNALLEGPEANSGLPPQIWGGALQVCAVAGNYQSSMDILRLMDRKNTRPNLRHCASFLKALVNADEIQLAAECLQSMTERNCFDFVPKLPLPAADFAIVQTVVAAYAANGDYQQARFLVNQMKEGVYGDDVFPTEQSYHCLLDACTDPKEAAQLIKEMRLSRRYRIGAVPPTAVSYTRAITVCRKVRDVETARFLIQNARHDGIQPDVFMYSAAIWTAASARDGESALEFYHLMEKCSCVPNIVSYNGVIASLASCGRVEEALRFYDTLRSKKLSPTRTTYLYLSRAIRKLRDADERLHQLSRIYEDMEDSDRCVDVGGPIIEDLIGTLGCFGRYTEARQVFDEINGPSDASCLRAVLFACSTATPPQWEEALSLLHTSDIIEGTSSPAHMDACALCHAIVACSKANRWDESLQLLRVYGDGCASLIAVNSLIAACGRSGRPDMAMEVLNEMEIYGLVPDLRSYRSAIIACNQAEHEKHRVTIGSRERISVSEDSLYPFEWWECALSLLRRMKEDGLKPDTQCFSSAISACEAAGQWQRALSILQSMLNDDHDSSLNLYCFNAAISACEKGGAWVEALEIFERMRMQGGRKLIPTIVTYGSIILALDKAGQKELAMSIYEEGQRKGILNPWKNTKGCNGELIRALDFHRFSAAMARSAIRSYIEALLSRTISAPQSDLIIIVGKGKHSESGRVLGPVVQALCAVEYDVRAEFDRTNDGRLIIQKSALDDLVIRRGWR